MSSYELVLQNALRRARGRAVSRRLLKKIVVRTCHRGNATLLDDAAFDCALSAHGVVNVECGDASPPLQVLDTGAARALGGREQQEDCFLFENQDGAAGDLRAAFAAAVFDGHGGAQVSQALSHPRTGLLARLWRASHTRVWPPRADQRLTNALFERFDAEMRAQNTLDGTFGRAGSTAVLAVQRGCWLALYNVGDSRGALFDARTGRCVLCTEDHKPELARERRRVRRRGGTIAFDASDCMLRVDSFLGMTRAFGDFDLPPDVITARPDVYVYRHCLSNPHDADNEQNAGAHLILILASDGVWDEWSMTEVGRLCVEHANSAAQALAERLVSRADERLGDNATAVVTKFA